MLKNFKISDAPVSESTALAVLKAGPGDMPSVFAAASVVRREYFGDRVHLCSIVNARSGACTEDCAFCAQSAHHDTEAEVFDLVSGVSITGARDKASKLPIGHFGVVTSGNALGDDEVEAVCRTIEEDTAAGRKPDWCGSLGGVSADNLQKLKKAGLKRFHHNLETSASFFPEVCTTHTYEERLETLRSVKASGLQVCSGGILGLGESLEQRVELAMTLAAEGVDSIPLNLLVPIKGTKMGDVEPIKPLDALKAVSMFRLTNPTAEIKVCAGRPHLGSLQAMIFHAGATGMMIGDLLTISGCGIEQDLQMLKDLQLDYDIS